MDLQAVWNRMDELEKLVISQAREIDNLKRTLRISNQYNNQSDITTNNNTQQHLFYPNFLLNRQPSYLPPISNQLVNNNVSAPPQPASQAVLQPQMNSFVHPQSAIPPVAIRPIANVPAITQNTHGLASQESQKLVHNLNSLLSENRPPPVSRWSLAPSAIDSRNLSPRVRPSHYPGQQPNGVQMQPEEEELNDTGGKHERQSFVESFKRWQSRYRDEDSRGKPNCEITSPCAKSQKSQNGEQVREAQQVPPSHDSSANTPTKETSQQPPTGDQSQSSAKVIYIPTKSNLMQFNVSSLEPSDNETSDDENGPPFTYITFNKPSNNGKQLWKPISDPRKFKKRHKQLSGELPELSLIWEKQSSEPNKLQETIRNTIH